MKIEAKQRLMAATGSYDKTSPAHKAMKRSGFRGVTYNADGSGVLVITPEGGKSAEEITDWLATKKAQEPTPGVLVVRTGPNTLWYGLEGQKPPSSVDKKPAPTPTTDPLEKKLFALAAGPMQSPDQFKNDPDKQLIYKRGKSWKKVGHFVPMKDGQCHWNVSRLYSEGKIDSIVIGYAHNHQGWHQHTWALLKNSLVETTRENQINDLWYGVALKPEEAKAFAQHCSENRPGAGMVRTTRGGSINKLVKEETK